jgi:hypothetical protein
MVRTEHNTKTMPVVRIHNPMKFGCAMKAAIFFFVTKTLLFPLCIASDYIHCIHYMSNASLVELGLFVGAIALSVTYCMVKCLAQVEQSRCVEIDCCCSAVKLRRAVESRSTVIDVVTPQIPGGRPLPHVDHHSGVATTL